MVELPEWIERVDTGRFRFGNHHEPEPFEAVFRESVIQANGDITEIVVSRYVDGELVEEWSEKPEEEGE